jgi:phosphoribosylanthranilate isomerase
MRKFPVIQVKICSITNEEDAILAAQYGADAIGLIFADSPRRITPEQAGEIVRAVPPFVTTVGVFMNQTADFVEEASAVSGVDRIQLHGEESPEFCARVGKRIIKRIRVKPSDTAAFIMDRIKPYAQCDILLDPGAGAGQIFDWRLVSGLEWPIILAGGLNPNNVWAAIQMAHPFAVDVSSGVECCTGKKDPEKLKAFIQEVKV